MPSLLCPMCLYLPDMGAWFARGFGASSSQQAKTTGAILLHIRYLGPIPCARMGHGHWNGLIKVQWENELNEITILLLFFCLGMNINIDIERNDFRSMVGFWLVDEKLP